MESYLYLFQDYQLCLVVLIIICIIIVIDLSIIIFLLSKFIKLFTFKFLSADEIKNFEKNIVDDAIRDRFNPKN